MFIPLSEAIWRVEKLAVEAVLPEYGADEHRNALEYLSNSVT